MMAKADSELRIGCYRTNDLIETFIRLGNRHGGFNQGPPKYLEGKNAVLLSLYMVVLGIDGRREASPKSARLANID
jgi:hypothetical protein